MSKRIRFWGPVLGLAVLIASPIRAQPASMAPSAESAPVAESASAEPPAPKVVGVKFEGLGRVDEETARLRVKVVPGAPLDPQAVTDDIRSLYGTGAFEDVVVRARPSRDGVVLVYQLKERPAIDQVLLEGNEEIDEEDLRKKITVRPGTILDIKRVERSVQAVRDHYVEQGFFLAEVDWRLDPRPDNLVNVVVVIHEHAKVKVQRVEFVGNEHIPADELKAAMITQEGSLLGFMTGKGLFSKEIFEDDPRRVEFYYNTKGYAEARCDPPVVMLSRDRQFIVISITVHEGEKYTVGKVEVDGDLLFPKEELEKNLKLKTGDLFNVLNVQADDAAIGTRYRDLGYAYASVSNAHVPHRDTRVIDFTYVIQKGELARFGRIDIIGNDGTRDWTIRREMRVYEGDLYNETRLKESENRIRRLGFFEKVEVRPRPGRQPNEVDIVVEVKERQTGAFTVGAGISSIENFMFQAQVSKQNFLGRGQNLSFQAILSSLRTIFMLSFEEPYFLDTDWTIGIDAYNYEMLYYDFTRRTKGINVTFGRRITDEFGLSTTYKIEGVNVSMGGQQGVTNIPVAHLFEQGLTSSLTATAYWDNRDDRMFPTKGNHSSVSLEWAGKQLGSDFEYLKFMARANQYFPFVLGSVLKLSGTYGFIGSPSGAQVPLFERFYVGGIFTVRGFDRYSLGPTIPTGAARDPAAALVPFTIGGNKELIFNAEVEFPIFMPIGIRGVVFFDAGNAFDNDEQISLLALRTSAGVGIRWWSPIGPLRFEWGFPLRPKGDEPPMVFEFNIGAF